MKQIGFFHQWIGMSLEDKQTKLIKTIVTLGRRKEFQGGFEHFLSESIPKKTYQKLLSSGLQKEKEVVEAWQFCLLIVFVFLMTNLLRTIEKAKAFELNFHLFRY